MNFGRSFKKNGAACQPDEGERWGCLVQDRASRFVVASATGPLSEELIEQAVTITVQRTHQRELHWRERWLARLPDYPQASLSKAGAHRQTGTAPVGGARDGHIDENGQASR